MEEALAGLPLHPTSHRPNRARRREEKKGNLQALEPAGAYSTLKKALVFDMIADDAKDR